jgi:hypothetical protein
MTWRHKTVTKQHRNQIKALTLRSAFTCFGKAHTRTIARSWGRWLRIMARDGHVRSTATRLLRRLVLGQLACAVNTWRAVANTWREVANNWRTISMACVQRHTQALQASMIVYHRVLMHMLLRKLAVVWRTWCIYVRNAKDDVVDRFSATTMRRLCLSFKRSHLLVIARCWTSWRNYLAYGNRVHQAAVRMLRRVLLIQLARGFRTWRAAFSKSVHAGRCAQLCYRILTRMTAKAFAHAWRSWTLLLIKEHPESDAQAGRLQSLILDLSTRLDAALVAQRCVKLSLLSSD